MERLVPVGEGFAIRVEVMREVVAEVGAVTKVVTLVAVVKLVFVR